MKIEHIAYNVSDPASMAQWYVEHLGLTLKRSGDPPISVRFLADDGGTVMLELYHNDKAPILDYANMKPATMHLAFSTNDVDRDFRKLVAAGASIANEPDIAPNGDRLAMLRDPWGLPLQLIHRSKPMI